MSKCNNQSKQNRTHVIAVRVTEEEREQIEYVAYKTRRKPTRVLLDAFLQAHKHQTTDSTA